MGSKSKKHIVDADKLAEIFGIEWEKSELHVFLDDKDGFSYCFKLRNKRGDSGIRLYLYDELPNQVSIDIESQNDYSSSIVFGNITKVKYIPKYRAVRLESHTKTHFSILKIYWRGQFDLLTGLKEENYSKSVWGKS
jgi:hypothetical protein